MKGNELAQQIIKSKNTTGWLPVAITNYAMLRVKYYKLLAIPYSLHHIPLPLLLNSLLNTSYEMKEGRDSRDRDWHHNRDSQSWDTNRDYSRDHSGNHSGSHSGRDHSGRDHSRDYSREPDNRQRRRERDVDEHYDDSGSRDRSRGRDRDYYSEEQDYYHGYENDERDMGDGDYDGHSNEV